MTNGHESSDKSHGAEHDGAIANTDKDRRDGEDAWLTALEQGIDEIATQPPQILYLDLLKLDWPYILMLSMAILGIGYVSFSGEPWHFYWWLFAPTYCVLCIVAGWRHVEGKDAHIGLIWTQILHWSAFLVAMHLIYLPEVRDVVNNNAAGLNLMTILALATFVAGVHARAWQICFVGAILAIAVPGIAWIEQSALFVMVSLVGVVLVAGSLWVAIHAKRRRASKAS